MAAERTVDAYLAALPYGLREIAEAIRRLAAGDAKPEPISTAATRLDHRLQEHPSPWLARALS